MTLSYMRLLVITHYSISLLADLLEPNVSFISLLSRQDSEGRRLDKGCSPPTSTWEVLLHSADGRIRLSAPVTHAAYEGYHVVRVCWRDLGPVMSCYRLLDPGEYVVSVYLTGVHASSLNPSSLPPDSLPHHQSCYRLLEPGEYVLSVYLTGVHAASLTGSRDEEKALRHLKFQLVNQYNVSAQVGGGFELTQKIYKHDYARLHASPASFQRAGAGRIDSKNISLFRCVCMQPSDPEAYKKEYARLQGTASLHGTDPEAYKKEYGRLQAALPGCTAQGKRFLAVRDSLQWVFFSHTSTVIHLSIALPHHNPYPVCPPSTSAARTCLKGKRLLVVGDSQQWVLFSHLLSFLSSSSRCRLLQGLGDRRSSLVRLRCDKGVLGGGKVSAALDWREGRVGLWGWEEAEDRKLRTCTALCWVPGSEGQHVAVHHTYFALTIAHMQGPVPWVPGSEGQHVAVHHTYFAPTVTATYYGAEGNGFAVASRLGPAVSTTYYGAEGNGFAVARIPVDLNATAPDSASLNDRKRRRDLNERAAIGSEMPTGSSRRRSGDRSQGGAEQYDSLEGRDVLDMSATDEDPRDLRTASRIREEEQERERQRAADADQIVAVFVAHSNASEPLYRDWMVNHTRRGPLANEHAPFDFVLASSGLHDLAAFDSPEEYAAALDLGGWMLFARAIRQFLYPCVWPWFVTYYKSGILCRSLPADREFVASVRFAVNGGMGGPGLAVVWLGPWAVQQSAVAPGLLPSMNHPRLSAFDAAAHSLINSWKVPFISTIPMTLSRPDLSKDGTHYSWPVSMAMLELWLGSVCPVQPTLKDWLGVSSAAMSSLLANLPSRGNFSAAACTLSSSIPVYICDHDTSPPSDQIITTDPTNILLRALTMKKTRDAEAAKAAQDKGKKTASGASGASASGTGAAGISGSAAAGTGAAGAAVAAHDTRSWQSGLQDKGKRPATGDPGQDDTIGATRSGGRPAKRGPGVGSSGGGGGMEQDREAGRTLKGMTSERDVDGLTVERLRACLKEKGLSIRGRKEELVARLKLALGLNSS
ncbi:unnamed protein product [Closterium sp. NIES-65]|nr:unnamed protein product [Closterium sp. NIES-65]